jgi:hypothetical protein
MNRWELEALRKVNLVPSVSLVELEAQQTLRREFPKAATKIRMWLGLDEFEARSVRVRVWMKPHLLLMERRFSLRSIDDAMEIVACMKREFAAVEAEEDLRDAHDP